MRKGAQIEAIARKSVCIGDRATFHAFHSDGSYFDTSFNTSRRSNVEIKKSILLMPGTSNSTLLIIFPHLFMTEVKFNQWLILIETVKHELSPQHHKPAVIKVTS